MNVKNLYLQHIVTHLPDAPIASVYCINNFSHEIAELLQEKLGVDIKIHTGKITKKTKKVDAIFAFDEPGSAQKTYDLSSLLNILNDEGVFIVGRSRTPNNTFTDNKGTVVPLRLSQKTDEALSSMKLFPIFREPIGKLMIFEEPSDELKKLATKLGALLPNHVLYSPYQLYLYKKDTQRKTPAPYVSQTSLKNRSKRIYGRIKYKVENHKVNDYIVATRRAVYASRIATAIARRAFEREVFPDIPSYIKNEGKIRLVIAMTWLEIGGVERVMLNIIRGLPRNKFEIHLITTATSQNPWHSEFAQHVDSITHLPDTVGDKWTPRLHKYYLAEYLNRQKCDVLLFTNSQTTYEALPLVAESLPELRSYDILHTHGTPLDNDAYLRSSMPFDGHITRRIVIDEYLKEYYVDKYGVDPKRIIVIYNGLAPSILQQAKKLTKAPRKGKKWNITYIGRLDTDKSPERLVTIANEIRKRELPAYIKIYGGGPLGDIMRQQAQEAELTDTYVHFAGFTDKALEAANEADYTILVSNAEGVPMATLESMAAGTPAILPKVGGLPEIVDHEQDGFLADIKSVDGEAAKIALFMEAIESAVRLSQKEYDTLSKNSRKKIDKRFSHMTDIYTTLLETGEFESSRQ